MARFERVSMDPIEWGKTLGTFPDAIVFQTPEWLSFIAETQEAELVLAALKEGNETLGYYTGLIIRKFGLKILGSPFRGWSTPYMGFNMRPSVPRRVAVEAMKDFAFRELGCIHFEMVDSHLTVEDLDGLGFVHQMHGTMETDLTQSEEVLFRNFSSSCRRNIRHAEKKGVVVSEALDAEFADEYAEQLEDVFAKQDMVAFYGADRVHCLIKHLDPTGMLLRLRARDAEGRCIATGLYPAMNQAAFYWGGASWRQHQKLCPNETLHWHAMRYWKKRGMKVYNFVGTIEFKRRFGGKQTTVPMIAKSRSRLISRLRSSGPKIARAAFRIAWKLKSVARGKRSG